MVDPVNPINPVTHSLHRRKTVRQILLAVVIFVSGIVIGAGGMVLFFQYRVFRPPAQPKKMAAEVTRDIQGRLGLSDIQAGQVEAIFAKEFQTMDSIRNEFEAQIDAQRESLITEMEMVLTPEQFAQWRDEFQSRRRRMRGPFPPGPPPGENRPRPDSPRPGNEDSRPDDVLPPQPW